MSFYVAGARKGIRIGEAMWRFYQYIFSAPPFIMTDRPTDQRTDGHEGSYGSYTSNDNKFIQKAFQYALYGVSLYSSTTSITPS